MFPCILLLSPATSLMWLKYRLAARKYILIVRWKKKVYQRTSRWPHWGSPAAGRHRSYLFDKRDKTSNWKSAAFLFLCFKFFISSGFIPLSLNRSHLTFFLLVYLVGWVLWHINHCWLFNVKSSLYIYIKCIWFGLFGFYGISTILIYLMSNPVFTYVFNRWFENTFCRYIRLNDPIVLFLTIQFFISQLHVICLHPVQMSNCAIWPKDRTLSGSTTLLWRCPWCNGYRRRKWTRRHEFKSWTRLIGFHIGFIPWERYESNYSPSSYG